MTLYGQYLYYTDWEVGVVLRVSKLIGNSSNTSKVLLKTNKVTSLGVKVVYPLLQQQGRHYLACILVTVCFLKLKTLAIEIMASVAIFVY